MITAQRLARRLCTCKQPLETSAEILLAAIARRTRTLATMFAAGVPLVEALDSVDGAAGNALYLEAARKVQSEVSTGTSLTMAMQNANVFLAAVVEERPCRCAGAWLGLARARPMAGAGACAKSK